MMLPENYWFVFIIRLLFFHRSLCLYCFKHNFIAFKLYTQTPRNVFVKSLNICYDGRKILSDSKKNLINFFLNA